MNKYFARTTSYSLIGTLIIRGFTILSIIRRSIEFSIGYQQLNTVPWEYDVPANKPTRSPGVEAMRHVMDGLMSAIKLI